jgi:pyruvate formate lyase activating enzyme
MPTFPIPQTAAFNMRRQPICGSVFNVMRFSTHDGPGIRTSVFLKGCPLSCWWCHNPENWRHVPAEVYLPERCTRCGLCVANCPAGALAGSAQEVVCDPLRCRHCGRCVEVCPSGARERTGWEAGISELVEAIARDTAFYDQSGGGVTFSGGEPLAQPEFLTALLDACGRLEIHRAVDTCGYAAQEVLFEVARRTDLFLYDLKSADTGKHRAATGVGNELILSNLRRLSESGSQLIIRIPLIPGVNDSEADIAGIGGVIAGLAQRHPVHLLPFHRAAAAKYQKLGLAYRGEALATPPAERVAAAARSLERLGLTVNVGG